MGRPLNKKYFGEGTRKIAVTRYRFDEGAETAGASTAAWILNQRSSNKFTVTDGNSTQVMTLVNKANGSLAEGEFTVNAVLDDSTVVQVTRFYNRKIQYEGGTANVAKIKWEAGGDDTEADGTATVDAQ